MTANSVRKADERKKDKHPYDTHGNSGEVQESKKRQMSEESAEEVGKVIMGPQFEESTYRFESKFYHLLSFGICQII